LLLINYFTKIRFEGAKVRISEQKTKRNFVFFVFSNESTFETPFKGTNK